MAMPEAGLGFCTGAGMSWVLPHLRGKDGQADKALGRYLALTGRWLNAADALWCGLVGYYVPSHEFPTLEEELLHLQYEPGTAARNCLWNKRVCKRLFSRLTKSSRLRQ